jgi:hypothetical protein
MNQQLPAEFQLRLARERRADQAREAEQARAVAEPRQPVRQAVGLALVRFGERLAEDNSLQPARPR